MPTTDGTPPTARLARRGRWSPPLGRLPRPRTTDPRGAPNIEGRRPAPTAAGFGQLWEKRFSVRLPLDMTPEALMADWRAHFHELWPRNHALWRPLTGLQPGEVAAVELPVPGGMRLSTGVLVFHSGPDSFTLQTVQGHMFAGWITFSTSGTPGDLCARLSIEMRASDPLYEIGLMLGGQSRENSFWSYVLSALGQRHGQHPLVVRSVRLADRRRNWAAAGNIWYNAWIRTTLIDASRLVKSLPARARQQRGGRSS